MTILFTLENPERTGAPRMTLQYARALVAGGHRVLVACGPCENGTSIVGDLEEAGVQVLDVPSFSPRNAGKVLLRLNSAIRTEGVTCVVGSQQRDHVLACLVAGFTGARCVVFAQNQHVFRGSRMERGMKERVYRWALRRRADLVICVSDAVARGVGTKFGVDDGRTRVVVNGIDIEGFPTFTGEQSRSVRRELGVSDDDLLLLTVGRIDRQKGQDILLKAFRDVADERPRARLAIVGDVGRSADMSETRRYHGRLRSIVEDSGLEDHVLFLGWRDDVPQLLSAADLYLQPSRWEGWPLALVEAMAAGLPALASDCSGRPRDFVDDVHGWIVPTGDVGALAQAMGRALTKSRPELEAMGGRARELAELHYDIRRGARRFVELVEEVAQ